MRIDIREDAEATGRIYATDNTNSIRILVWSILAIARLECLCLSRRGM
ncbi:MAG: hypothetical protein ACTSXJ_00135 [Candidatus Baldrarchaeia archaeon]